MPFKDDFFFHLDIIIDDIPAFEGVPRSLGHVKPEQQLLAKTNDNGSMIETQTCLVM